MATTNPPTTETELASGGLAELAETLPRPRLAYTGIGRLRGYHYHAADGALLGRSISRGGLAIAEWWNPAEQDYIATGGNPARPQRAAHDILLMRDRTAGPHPAYSTGDRVRDPRTNATGTVLATGQRTRGTRTGRGVAVTLDRVGVLTALPEDLELVARSEPDTDAGLFTDQQGTLFG